MQRGRGHMMLLKHLEHAQKTLTNREVERLISVKLKESSISSEELKKCLLPQNTEVTIFFVSSVKKLKQVMNCMKPHLNCL